MTEELKIIHSDDRYIIYRPNIEWVKHNIVKCENCNAIVLPQCKGSRCQCGRIESDGCSILIQNLDNFNIVTL